MTDNVRVIISLIKIAILALAVISAYIRVRKEGGQSPAPLTFLVLGTACHLCTEAYYLAHLLLASKNRMPYFSAEDIGIYGSFLLFSSCLKTAVPHSGKYAAKFVVLSGVFTLINAGLYVHYGTEIIPALFYFLVMGTFMVAILQSLEDLGSLSGRRFALFAAAAAFLSALLLVEPLLFGGAKTVVLYLEALFWFAVMVYLVWRTAGALKSGDRRALPLAFATFLCSIFTMYMSYDPWYSIADILSASFNILIFAAVLQEVKRI